MIIADFWQIIYLIMTKLIFWVLLLPLTQGDKSVKIIIIL